jgi:oligopeptidase B
MAQNSTPKAPKVSKSLVTMGHERIDSYYWMNQRDSADVLKYIKEENDYCKDYFKPLNPIVDELMEEFDQRIDPNEKSARFLLNKKWYQVRSEANMEYQKIFLIEGDKESLFFDENERSKNHDYYDLADWVPSPNNKYLAVAEDFIGRRKNTISIRKNSNGKYLKDRIEDANGDILWSNDNKAIYYIKKDEQTLRSYQVYRHIVGKKSSADELIYQEDDEKFSVGFSKSKTGKYIFIGSYSSLTSEILWTSSTTTALAPASACLAVTSATQTTLDAITSAQVVDWMSFPGPPLRIRRRISFLS